MRKEAVDAIPWIGVARRRHHVDPRRAGTNEIAALRDHPHPDPFENRRPSHRQRAGFIGDKPFVLPMFDRPPDPGVRLGEGVSSRYPSRQAVSVRGRGIVVRPDWFDGTGIYGPSFRT